MASLDIISPLPPYPPHAGGTAHIFRASRELSRYFTLALYTLARDSQAVEWGPMRDWCRDTQAFPADGPGWPWNKDLRHLFDPPAVQQEQSRALDWFLTQRWHTTPPDIVQFEFTTMAQYAPLARACGALTVCTAHNVAFLAQVRRAQRERDLWRRARRWLGAFSLWQYELRSLGMCDLVVALAEADAHALRRWMPRLPIATLPSAIAMREWPLLFDPSVEHQVLFVGNYAHPPNVEGAEWLARAVWPLVRAAQPAARLTLAGRTPPPAIQALAAPDIAVPGTLDDLRPLYARAAVVVAPIFWGSGIRIKLLEALASGLPVVTTAAAAEGIELRHNQSALFAQSADEFARAIVRLLESRELRATLGQHGRALVEHGYSWEQVGRKLAGLYAGARPRNG